MENNSKAPTFVEVEINEQEFVKQMRNNNTVRKTKSVMNSFNKFVSQTLKTENVQIELLNPTELDNLIGKFLLSIRKADGKEYEPDTLTSYHRGIEGYLREHLYKYSIIKDHEFEMTRSVLASKSKELKKGGNPIKSEPLTTEEENILIEKGVLGRQDLMPSRNSLGANILYFW